MYEVVLLQVATAKGDVSGHLQQVPHGERGGLALDTAQLNLVLRAHKQTHTQKCVVQTYSSWSVLSQEAFHVSTGHQLQQDETWQDVQTDADATHNVLMAEFAVWINSE